MTVSTAPYPTFDHALFGTSEQSFAWRALQHELFRGVHPHYAQVKFCLDLGTGYMHAEIQDLAGREIYVSAVLNPNTGLLTVVTYKAGRYLAETTFDRWEVPELLGAVTAFILRVAER